ncbi:hypothetical protein [Carboxylicivirga sp. N1Y90]|uniref:hypothetical protein n=1 Tax=Carboxylicivirga fragile TaxID=3417571 RepID=UPI003D341429|nr:hypothetical protein [Marinilabiliaceae bacterium N1Y90]
MKLRSLLSLLALSLLAACSSTQWTDSSYYEDDIYYRPQSSPMTVSDDYIPVKEDKEVKKQDKKDFNELTRDYQKTEFAQEDNRNFSQIQNEYLTLLSNDSIQETDSLVYYNEETGYWVNGFQGGQMDQDYAERMIRFHGPFNGIPYWSPLYNDMVYFNNWDWNVYVDGNYAYAFPSWTSPMYNNYRFNYGYHNPWRWGYGGYYDPWYGYGYGHSHWYSCGYWPGYHHGYYNGWNNGYYYGGGGGYYPGGSGTIAQERNYRPRGGQATSVRPGGSSVSSGRSDYIKTKTFINKDPYTVGNTRVSYNEQNKRTVTDTNSGRTYSYSNRQNPNTKSTSTNKQNSSTRATRRSYTGNQTTRSSSGTSTSRSTNSSNRRSSSYTRPSSNNRTSNVNRNTSTRSTNRTYSGNSNRSNYSNNKSSTTRSSYSPSRSSNSNSRSSYSPSRSSGSSSRSYSGSSSSSGSRSSSGSSGSSSRSSGGSSRSSGGRR